MTDYTNITENFGDTICQEFIQEIEEKFRRFPLVSKKNESLYCLGDKNLIKGLTQKLNNYFNTMNNNEFIVGYIIDTQSNSDVECDIDSDDECDCECYSCLFYNLDFDCYSYLITNYGNIYRFLYGNKLTESELATEKYIEITDKIGRCSNFFEEDYDIYIKLEKILINNQKLFDAEINEIKKDILIKNTCRYWNREGITECELNIEFLYEPANDIHFLIKKNDSLNSWGINFNLIKIKNLSLENWKKIIKNHKKITELQKLVQPTEPYGIESRYNNLKKIPEHFNCPISTDVMEEPVIAMDGHTYDRASIEMWFQNHNTSPMTREIISTNLIPNFNLKSQINEWYNN